jgi:hypothetical protein
VVLYWSPLANAVSDHNPSIRKPAQKLFRKPVIQGIDIAETKTVISAQCL